MVTKTTHARPKSEPPPPQASETEDLLDNPVIMTMEVPSSLRRFIKVRGAEMGKTMPEYLEYVLALSGYVRPEDKK